jgi:hypothetical protein
MSDLYTELEDAIASGEISYWDAFAIAEEAGYGEGEDDDD